MTLEKLQEVLEAIGSDRAIAFHGSHIGCTGGGELVFYFSSQPSKSLHTWLLKNKFVFVDSAYIYRP